MFWKCSGRVVGPLRHVWTSSTMNGIWHNCQNMVEHHHLVHGQNMFDNGLTMISHSLSNIFKHILNIFWKCSGNISWSFIIGHGLEIIGHEHIWHHCQNMFNHILARFLIKGLIPFSRDLSSDKTWHPESLCLQIAEGAAAFVNTGFLDQTVGPDDKSPAIKGQSLL